MTRLLTTALLATLLSGAAHAQLIERDWLAPGDGLPIAALAADDNCAVAVFEEISAPGNTEEIDWTFTVS